MNEHEFDLLLSALKGADSVLLFTHISPDGDTLGSALALKSRLNRMGKKAYVLASTPVPKSLRVLPGIDEILTADDGVPQADLYVAVDVASESRLDQCFLPIWKQASGTWLIDHHKTSEQYSTYLLLESDAPATGILVYRLLKAMDMPFTCEEAICLYTAISTDTGNFIYDSTTPECFEIMSDLMKSTGFRMGVIPRILHREKEPAAVRLLSCALPKLHWFAEGKAVSFYLSLKEIEACKANQSDCEGLIDYAIDMRGVQMACFLRENDQGRIKCSLRSKAGYDVCGVARLFGGGGHMQAAGCTIELRMDEALLFIENAMEKEILSHE